MSSTSINPLVNLVEKLARHMQISLVDCIKLLELPHSSSFIDAGKYLLRDGDIHHDCGLLVSGFCCRHRVSSEGLRQIVAIHIPGEIYDLQQLYFGTADSSVQTLTRCEVVTISHQAIRQLVANRPSVERALFATMMVELSISREWMLNIGRRDGRTRLAHLLCELAYRLDRPGLPPGQAYELPMTQEQLGDALGLTAVHINRSLKGLVRDGLVGQSRRGVTIPNWELLVAEAGFNNRYLHMNSSELTMQLSRDAIDGVTGSTHA